MSHAESSSWASCTVPSRGRRGGFRGNQRLSQPIPVELARQLPTPCTHVVFVFTWLSYGWTGLLSIHPHRAPLTHPRI